MTTEDMQFIEELFRLLKNEMNTRFDGVEDRLDRINARLDRISYSIDCIEKLGPRGAK